MKSILTLKTAIIVSLFTLNVFQGICQNSQNKRLDNKEQLIISVDSSLVLDYDFKDSLDKDVRISDFRGKFVIIDLFFTGCGACITVNEGLKKVHDSLKYENIVFMSVSVDKNRDVWIQSITENAPKTKSNPWAGQYFPGKNTVVLFTGGSGENNEFCKKYVPDRFYPKLMLIGPNGKVVSTDLPRPDKNPNVLTSYIRQFLNK